MTDFLLLYQNGDPNWMDNKTPAEMGKAMQAWGDWFKQLEASGNLRNAGAALAKGGAVLTRNGQGFHTDASMSEVKELVGGFTVIQAKSIEDATKLAQGSPFLQNNPKAQILVRPILQQG
ncbi:MAG TPA: YciI family protein [Vicinamibacterales bacterium]|nr:YciI family protein [Vicinamibacterales bacterium]